MTNALSPNAAVPVGDVSAGAVAWRAAGQTQVTVIAKATFTLHDGEGMRRGRPRQLCRADVHYDNNPMRSVRWASDMAPHLGSVDVLFSGSAYASAGPLVQMLKVRLSLFDGERALLSKSLLVCSETGFRALPIVYERALGGLQNPENPVGANEPNILDPADPKRTIGLGPVARSWLARRRLLGGAARGRLEGALIDVPEGFDWSYFQASPPDQRVPSLRGDEWLVLEGLCPSGARVKTRLPGARGLARVYGLSAFGVAEGRQLALTLDMLCVDGDEQTCDLVFRRNFPLPPGASLHAVRVEAGVEEPNQPLAWPSGPLSAAHDDAHDDGSMRLSDADIEIGGDTVLWEPPRSPAVPAPAPVGLPTAMLSSWANMDLPADPLGDGTVSLSAPVAARPAMPFVEAQRPVSYDEEPWSEPAPLSSPPLSAPPLSASPFSSPPLSTPSSEEPLLPAAQPVFMPLTGSLAPVSAHDTSHAGRAWGAVFLAAMERAPAMGLYEGSSRPPVFSAFEREILEEHADQAAFLWSLREAGADDPRYDQKGLRRLDDRVEARLDALRLAEGAGWEAARAALDFPDAGGVFVASVVALDRGDKAGVAQALDAAQKRLGCKAGLIAAFGWVPFAHVERCLPGLFFSGAPDDLREVGIAACAQHRRDPGLVLGSALNAASASLRARALMAAGELGRLDLRGAVRDALQDDEEACRYAAGSSGVLLGEPESVRALKAMAEAGGPFGAKAACMAVRKMPLGEARAWLQGLARDPKKGRLVLMGSAALGDAAMVPWVVDQMAYPALARLAAGVFRTIVGADFAEDNLEGEPPEDFLATPTDNPDDDDVRMDPDEVYPWPKVPAVKAWWERAKRGFSEETRYLMGKPLSPAALEELLVIGDQQVRAAAAIELCLAGKRRVLPEVRGRASAAQRGHGGAS